MLKRFGNLSTVHKIYWTIIILFCLTPLVWFWGRDGIIINGVDTNFPLDPIIWFKRRFFVWDSVPNGGRDFSASVAGLFFHLVQVIPFALGASLQLTELLSLSFWFAMVVFAALIFAREFFPTRKMIQIFFVCLYSYNIYLFNTWENVKVSNLALVVTLPLVIVILQKFISKKLGVANVLLYTVFIGILASGAGINPAYFLTIFIGLALFTLVQGGVPTRSNRKVFRQTWLGFVLISITLVLTNSFWILPTSNYLFISSQSIGSLSDIGLSNWLDSLSANASFTNLFRLQGAWDWYAFEGVSGIPLYLDYVVNYFYRIPFVVFSFVVPSLALISFITKPKNQNSKLYITAGVFVVLGLFLGAGSHSPTGSLYLFLSRVVPFFSFFRSPWYIFTILTIIGLSTLACLALSNITSHIEKTKILSKSQVDKMMVLGIVVLVVGHLLYSYPLVSGKIFRPDRKDGFYVTYPEHVFDAKRYLDEQKSFPRYITYPDDTVENYKWGYRGVESITGLFSNKEYFAPSVVTSGDFTREYLLEFYSLLKRGSYESAWSMMDFVGADTLLFKEDISTLSAPIVLDQISEEITTFGDWHFVRSKTRPEKFFIPGSLYLNYSDDRTLAAVSSVLSENTMVVSEGDNQVSHFAVAKGKIPIINEFEHNDANPTNTTQLYTISVPHAGEYSIMIENLHNPPIQLTVGSKVVSTVSITDGHSLFAPVFLSRGEVEVEVEYVERLDLVLESNYYRQNNVLGLRSDGLPDDLSDTLVAYNDSSERVSLHIPTEGFDPYAKYELSFNYKYLYGSVPFVEILQNNARNPLRTEIVYSGSFFDWTKITQPFDPVETDSFITLVITMPANSKDDKSKAYFENISLKTKYDNRVFLIQENELEIESPQILWEKESPVSYKVKVSGVKDGYFLVFLENYNPDWILSSNETLGKTLHFTANGFANGWYVPGGEENQVLMITYAPQKYYKIGIGITSIWVVFVFGYYIFVKKTKNKKHYE